MAEQKSRSPIPGQQMDVEVPPEQPEIERFLGINKQVAEELDSTRDSPLNKFDKVTNLAVYGLKISHELEYQAERVDQEIEPESIRALKQIYSEKLLKLASFRQLTTKPIQNKIKPKSGATQAPPCKVSHFIKKCQPRFVDHMEIEEPVPKNSSNNKSTINLVPKQERNIPQPSVPKTAARPSKISKSGIGQNRSVNYGNLDPEVIRPTQQAAKKEPAKPEEKNPFSSAWDKLNEDEAKAGKAPTARGPKRGFSVPRGNNEPEEEERPQKRQKTDEQDIADNPLYKNVDPAMIERINNDILTTQLNVHWEDIAGLEDVKATLNEMIILPHKRPELFTGLRQPPRGLLLFGPPGNGKTLIAKAVATEANLTFFAISASSLTSKWIGDGEKMVKALFAVARDKQPSFIFIDEIDSILTARGSEEHEATRRLKTEFLLQFDGAASGGDTEKITVMGATNRPQDLDEAARRRLTKRIYVPLPEEVARVRLIENLLKKTDHSLSSEEIAQLGRLTGGFSGNDLTNLCKDAAMGPLRENKFIEHIDIEKLRPLGMIDFTNSLKKIKPAVSLSECVQYEEWNQQFGESGL